jgi:hypothetical protein
MVYVLSARKKLCHIRHHSAALSVAYKKKVKRRVRCECSGTYRHVYFQKGAKESKVRTASIKLRYAYAGQAILRIVRVVVEGSISRRRSKIVHYCIVIYRVSLCNPLAR